MTTIEWVKNQDGSQGRTWNPVSGCTKISPGCKNCYAERMARRQVAMGFARHERGSDNDDTWIAYSNAIDPDTGRWSGEITCRYKELDAPLKRKKPTTYFVCSMSDLFHEDVPDEFILRIFDTIAMTPQHTYQILTKRPLSMLDWYQKMTQCGYLAVEKPDGRICDNVWLGVSIENQAAADARREDFRATPAAVKYVSYEPALGPVDWTGWEFIDQLIFGGESGPGARPAHPDWFRNARDWAGEHGIARFFKGWGAWIPDHVASKWSGIGALPTTIRLVDSGGPFAADSHWMARVGKKAAGRLLDGCEHNEMPRKGI